MADLPTSPPKNPPSPYDLVVVGSCNVDLISYVPRLPKAGETINGSKFSMGFGGKGANQCVMAARLGAKTAMVAKVGDDTFGHKYIENFKDNNVNSDFVSITDKASTGVAPIAVNDEGENSIVIVSGANLILGEEDLKAARSIITTASVVVCQLEIKPEITQLALTIAKNAGVLTILNPAPAIWLDCQYYTLTDVFCANETEAEYLTGTAVNSKEDAMKAITMFLDRGCTKVVLTLGSKGAVVVTKDDPVPVHIPAKETQAVDTTGAGDSFVGALAFYLAKFKELSFEEMVRRANEIAAISVTKPGTQTSFPKKEQLPKELFEPGTIKETDL